MKQEGIIISVLLAVFIIIFISGCDLFTKYTLTVQISPADAGIVVLSPDQDGYSPGTKVTLAAIPANGYIFDHWEGDVTGSTNPATVTMDADRTVTAVFTVHSLTVQISPPGSGTVTKFPDQDNYSPGTEVTLTAVPADGYIFDHWEGDVTGSTNPVTFTMDTDMTVTALFCVDLTGNWNGTMTLSGTNHTLQMNVTQTGADLGGSATLVGPDLDYTIDASVAGDAVSGTLIGIDQGDVNVYDIDIDGTLNATLDQIAGTVYISESNLSGTFSVDKQ